MFADKIRTQQMKYKISGIIYNLIVHIWYCFHKISGFFTVHETHTFAYINDKCDSASPSKLRKQLQIDSIRDASAGCIMLQLSVRFMPVKFSTMSQMKFRMNHVYNVISKILRKGCAKLRRPCLTIERCKV